MSDILPPDNTHPPPGGTVPADDRAEEERLARLADQVALNLRLGRQADARRAVDELLRGWPESTTAEELAGDVAYAEGQYAEARKHYRRALELEPANADAERKYGTALLARTPEEQQAALIHQIIADPKAYQSSSRKPLNAVLNAMIFPGLGQLYNRQQEKGLGFLAAAAVALIVMLSVLMPYVSASLTLSSPNARTSQQESAQEVIDSMGMGQWLIAIGCGLVFLGLYLWGMYDAWRQAQSETEQALGVG